MAFPLDYGSISFRMHRTDADAEFIRCRQTADKNLIVQHVLNVWKLNEPGMLMRVVGTPPDEDIASVEDQAEFLGALEGVLRAAATTKAWLFCTGLSFGMASALGTTLGRSRHNCDCPLIGFAQWGSVQKPEQLEVSRMTGEKAVHGDVREYKDFAPDDDMTTISLQANHSHFVLVNPLTPEEIAAGATERKLSTPDGKPMNKLLEARKKSYAYAHEFEAAASVYKSADEPVPRIMCVMCGDETTLAEVVSFCRQGTGLVLCCTITGGLADALYKFAYNDGVVPDGWEAFSAEFAELKEMNARKPKKASKKLVAASKVNTSKAQSNGLHNFPFFAFSTKRGTYETRQAVLDALMSQISTTRNKVTACVEWDDAKRLKQVFTTMVPAWREDRADVLADACQLALELEHAECIRVLVRHPDSTACLGLSCRYWHGTEEWVWCRCRPPPAHSSCSASSRPACCPLTTHATSSARLSLLHL